MTAAVIQAAFSDWKLVKTRGAVQLIFEIPVENADLAYKVVGGMPDAAKERWFAIARLTENGVSAPSGEATDRAEKTVASRQPKEPISWHDMQPAQQAGILCNEPAFCKFLESTLSGVWRDFESLSEPKSRAASCVRELCNVRSRSDILPDTEAAYLWKEMVRQYRAWMREAEIV